MYHGFQMMFRIQQFLQSTMLSGNCKRCVEVSETFQSVLLTAIQESQRTIIYTLYVHHNLSKVKFFIECCKNPRNNNSLRNTKRAFAKIIQPVCSAYAIGTTHTLEVLQRPTHVTFRPRSTLVTFANSRHFFLIQHQHFSVNFFVGSVVLNLLNNFSEFSSIPNSSVTSLTRTRDISIEFLFFPSALNFDSPSGVLREETYSSLRSSEPVFTSNFFDFPVDSFFTVRFSAKMNVAL